MGLFLTVANNIARKKKKNKLGTQNIFEIFRDKIRHKSLLDGVARQTAVCRPSPTGDFSAGRHGTPQNAKCGSKVITSSLQATNEFVKNLTFRPEQPDLPL